MSDVSAELDAPAETAHRRIVFHYGRGTPEDFIIELLCTVFKKTFSEASGFYDALKKNGQAVCGTYRRAVAIELADTAQLCIRIAGHSLKITSVPHEDGDEPGEGRCNFCGTPAAAKSIPHDGAATPDDDDDADEDDADEDAEEDDTEEATDDMSEPTRSRQFNYAFEALQWHFARIPRDQLIATSRQFPGHMRADVQVAVEKLFSASPIRFFGLYEPYRYETLGIATLIMDGRNPPTIAPAQYEDVDVGENMPVKCLQNGLWLCQIDGLRFAVVLSSHREPKSETGIRIEITVPAGAAGADFVQRCFSELEDAVNAARSYRGKILSFDGETAYRGQASGIMVHRLPKVEREDVILPDATLKLLDRNVLRFVESREQLRRLGQSTRKGILLYGPPGTGKTHTIRYLASHLPSHTTLIITAAQVDFLAQYMNLARLLQPAMVVIEDVDLIARDRNEMGPCEETMLNALLNEMDGLKEDADILFILTTNRPEELESALASRPGRIDQAIEVPLPDEAGRGKLIELYGRSLPLGEAIVSEAAARTKGVSAAFIKELMRRIAQASLARDGGNSVEPDDIGEALDDMLFAGGRLNVKLLGGAQEVAAAV